MLTISEQTDAINGFLTDIFSITPKYTTNTNIWFLKTQFYLQKSTHAKQNNVKKMLFLSRAAQVFA